MNQHERISAILAELEVAERLSVAEICERFGVSKDTARRDIIKMEKLGAAERFHGGIQLPFLRRRLEDYKTRLIMNPDLKELVGKEAAGLVCNQDTVMLDLSATIQFVGQNITAKGVLAVTNSIDVAITLMSTPVERIYLTGGYLSPTSHALLGMSVLDRVKDFHYDIAFFGASAITPDGIYYRQEDDVTLKKSVMQVADKVVVVADHTKFTAAAPCRLDFAGVDILVTDEAPPPDLAEVLRQNGVEVVVVKKSRERNDR